MTQYLSQEDDYIPWRTIKSDVKFLQNMLKGTPVYPTWKAYLSSLLLPAHERLGFDSRAGDTFFDTQLRVVIIDLLCSLNHEACSSKAGSILEKWMESGSPDEEAETVVSPDYRAAIFCTAIAAGNRQHWDFMKQRLLNAVNANFKIDIVKALACTEDQELLREYVDGSITYIS